MTDNVAVTAAGAWPSDLAWRSGRNGVPKLLARDQFRGRGPGLRSSEVPGVLDGPPALVFLQVGSVNGVLQTLASGLDGADGDLAPSDLDGAAWLLKERPVPAARLQAPGAHERPPLHHDDPNTDETVRLAAGPNVQDFTVADRDQNVFWETSRRPAESGHPQRAPEHGIAPRSGRVRHLVQIFDVRAHGAVDALDFRRRRLDDVVLVGRVRAAAVAPSEVARGEPQRITGEHIARPGAGIARQDDRVDPGAAVHRLLRPDDHGIGGRAGGIVAARHVDLDVPESPLRQVRLERGQGVGRRHVRHEPQVELGHGPVGEDGLATRTGVSTDQALDIDRGARHQQLQRLRPAHVAHPVLHAQQLLRGVLVETTRRLRDHRLFARGERARLVGTILDRAVVTV